MKIAKAKKLYKTIEEVFKEYYITHEKEEIIPHLRSLRENWSIVSEQIVHFAINEISTLLNSARHESEQKKLPEELVEKSTDELCLIWQLINSWWELIKGSWWEREPDDFVFIPPEIQQLPHKDKDSFYNALVDLYYQGRITRRCEDIMMKRRNEAFKKYPIGRSMLAMMDGKGWEEEGYITESHHIVKQSEKEVRKYVEAVARQRNIPSWDREEKVQDVIGDLTAKYKRAQYHKRPEMYFHTQKIISNVVTDEERYQKAQKRTPPGGYSYIDEKTKAADGSNVSILDILTSKYNSLQTQPEEEFPNEVDPYDKLVADIRKAHGDNVAETAEVYLEIFSQQEGKKVKQQQVAQAIGKHPKTIKRHIEKIEQFLRERMKKINFGCPIFESFIEYVNGREI